MGRERGELDFDIVTQHWMNLPNFLGYESNVKRGRGSLTGYPGFLSGLLSERKRLCGGGSSDTTVAGGRLRVRQIEKHTVYRWVRASGK